MAAEAGPALRTRAPAKINLTLRVLGRRTDGYHDLDSLVAFAGVGDELALAPGPHLSLSIAGPFGAGLSAEPDNLVLRAVRELAARRPGLRLGDFHLTKRLPVASGIGGGSADAAAALRLVARANGMSPDDPDLVAAAAATGADVPVCLAGKARRMSGIGDVLGPPLRLPPLFAVLVNPGLPLATAAVFRELGLAAGENTSDARSPCPPDRPGAGDLLTAMQSGRNDLEAPARRLAPGLGDVLARLAALPECRLARMSGSGATCFALFDDCRTGAEAAKALKRVWPGRWVKATVLR